MKNYYKILIVIVVLYLSVFLIAGLGLRVEPTFEEENKAIQYKINFCESQGLESDLNLKEEGGLYTMWSSSYSLECFDENRLKFIYYQNAYEEAGITLGCTYWKYINIFSYLRETCFPFSQHSESEVKHG